MSSRKKLKKDINNTFDILYVDCIFYKVYVVNADAAAADKVLEKIADTQNDMLSRINITEGKDVKGRGFGMWMKRLGDARGMDDGAEVIKRDDYNNAEVSEDICNFVFEMTTKSKQQENILRQAAVSRAYKADWSHFFTYYEDAYSIALKKTNRKN